jgi:phosphatidate cytidylyltransferase
MSALFSAILGFLPFLQPGATIWTLLLTLAVVGPLVWTLLYVEVPRSLEAWTLAFASVGYIGLLGSHLTALRVGPYGAGLVLLAVLVTWVTDTGAYFTGKALGRHKLAPRISPGKTVEGAIGGFIAGAAATFAIWLFVDTGLSSAAAVALAVLLPALAQIGDLVESMIKRSLDIKDSSPLIPGHGGVLDRIDSILFAAITVFYVSRI